MYNRYEFCCQLLILKLDASSVVDLAENTPRTKQVFMLRGKHCFPSIIACIHVYRAVACQHVDQICYSMLHLNTF
jgi:hypothetical protein